MAVIILALKFYSISISLPLPGLQKMSKKIRCFLFSLTSFKKSFVVFYFRWFFQRIQRINEINETNSTNQRKKFSLIWPNFNEFSTKISTNQRKFQQIQRKFQRINENFNEFNENFNGSTKISKNQRKFHSLIRWIRWRIFKSIFIRWFKFWNQRNQRINIFIFNETNSTNKYFQRKNIFFGALVPTVTPRALLLDFSRKCDRWRSQKFTNKSLNVLIVGLDYNLFDYYSIFQLQKKWTLRKL